MRAYYQRPSLAAGKVVGSFVGEPAAGMPSAVAGQVDVASFAAEPFVAEPSAADKP